MCYNITINKAEKRGKIVQNTSRRGNIRNVMQIAIIVLLCLATLALDFLCCKGSETLRKATLCKLLQQLCGATAAILIMVRLNIRLFSKPQKWLYLIPCLIVAIDNFQFSAYFNGKMQLVYDKPADIALFAVYCLSVGLFEECIFRGIVFSVLAGIFPQNKKGFLSTYVVSSVVFGVIHIFNGFSAGAFLQAGYSILTGGLFAFCMIKTKNILCAAFVHGVYNFCGLLFGAFQPNGCTIGLGNGVVFDKGTVVTMLIVGVLIGLFVLYKVFTYTDEERRELYQKLGVSVNSQPNTEENAAGKT